MSNKKSGVKIIPEEVLIALIENEDFFFNPKEKESFIRQLNENQQIVVLDLLDDIKECVERLASELGYKFKVINTTQVAKEIVDALIQKYKHEIFALQMENCR